MQRCAGGLLHAMLGPQGLIAVMEAFRIEGLGAVVARRERSVRRRMPVLRHDDVLESSRQSIDERNDLVAPIDRQRPTRHEIGLQVDREKEVVIIDRDYRGHRDQLLSPPTGGVQLYSENRIMPDLARSALADGQEGVADSRDHYVIISLGGARAPCGVDAHSTRFPGRRTRSRRSGPRSQSSSARSSAPT